MTQIFNHNWRRLYSGRCENGQIHAEVFFLILGQTSLKKGMETLALHSFRVRSRGGVLRETMLRNGLSRVFEQKINTSFDSLQIS